MNNVAYFLFSQNSKQTQFKKKPTANSQKKKNRHQFYFGKINMLPIRYRFGNMGSVFTTSINFI